VDHVVAKYRVSERLACRVLGQHRSAQRKIPTTPDDEAALTADIVALATQYGRAIAASRRCWPEPAGW
jgi:putative transposase